MRTPQRQTTVGQADAGPAPARWPVRSGAVWICRRLAVALVGAGLLSGCGDSSGPDVSRLNPRGVPYLEGVPVPQGFELVVDMVMDREAGGRRMAKHTYRGRADLYAVRNFYREQMPLMGWDRVSDQNFQGVVTIRFEKQDEVCTVGIKSAGGFNRTEVTVLVGAFDRTPLQPPKQPVP